MRCHRIAPARKELRNGSNKSEREPTSVRSTNYGIGHLIQAFRGTGRTFSSLRLTCIGCHALAASPPIGLLLERARSKLKAQYGFVEGENGFNCVSCGTHRRAFLSHGRREPSALPARPCTHKTRPDVRLSPKATELPRRNEMTRCANRDRCTAANSISIRSPRRRARECWPEDRDRVPWQS